VVSWLALTGNVAAPGGATGSAGPGVRIKICGLTRPEETEAINRALPDFVGFVFAADSRRRVTPQRAAALRALIAPEVVTVGVFRDAPAEGIAELVERGVIGAVQLHGHESAEAIFRLRQLVAAPVVKAVSVHGLASVTVPTPADPTRATDPAFPADWLLFDHGPGGTGRSFDLALIDRARQARSLPAKPFFIAGGVGLGNLAEVLRRRPDGVDVSSGAESDGAKDPDKVRRLVELVRGIPA